MNQSNIYKAVVSDVGTVTVAGLVILGSIFTILYTLRAIGAY